MRLFLPFLILSCYSSVDDPPTEKKQVPKPAVVIKPDPPAEPIECEVKIKDYIDGCDVYFLLCEDGSSPSVVICHHFPEGVITNPPRPLE